MWPPQHKRRLSESTIYSWRRNIPVSLSPARGRRISLEETYDYLRGLKSEPRYSARTGMQKKAPRRLLPETLQAYKSVKEGRANYAVL